MNDKNELEKFLELSPETVKDNIEIVTPESLGQDFFLHISMNTNIREFVPVIGLRQNEKEDRTVPRVCVAPTLLGCMIGSADTENVFMTWHAGEKSRTGETYKGGWKIYATPFKVALKPGAKLVPVIKNSDEHWLVTYNSDTVTYVPEPAGKVFYRSINFIGKMQDYPQGEIELYVEVSKETGIRFSKNLFLTKGYWLITGPAPMDAGSWFNDKRYVLKELSKADYFSAKNATADMLSITEKLPFYLQW